MTRNICARPSRKLNLVHCILQLVLINFDRELCSWLIILTNYESFPLCNAFLCFSIENSIPYISKVFFSLILLQLWIFLFVTCLLNVLELNSNPHNGHWIAPTLDILPDKTVTGAGRGSLRMLLSKIISCPLYNAKIN